MAASNQRPGEMIQGINVTPLVDVVLVLLIVLMVTASYTVSQALPMELPTAQTGENQNTSLAISIDETGKYFLAGKALSPDALRQEVKGAKSKGKVSALLAADGRVAHKQVVRVIDLLRSEGVTQFAINVTKEELAP